MSSNSFETLNDVQAEDSALHGARRSLTGMANLYAWIIVSLGIIVTGAMLAQIEDGRVVSDPGIERPRAVTIAR